MRHPLFLLLAFAALPYISPASPSESLGGKTAPIINSLEMKLVSVPGTEVYFSVWDTRVQDFAAFVRATGYKASHGMVSIGTDGWKPRGATWKNPGFKQGSEHPVVGVTWYDAKAFCDWLTQREQSRGLIGAEQHYRLPTDKEWSAAVGGGKYTYGGNSWPPPLGTGNYAGSESVIGNEPDPWGITGSPRTGMSYRDAFPRTSPVNAFPPNRFGLYDMGGNVWQWCEDVYRADMNGWLLRQNYTFLNHEGGENGFRVQRGGSWRSTGKRLTRSDVRYRGLPEACDDCTGFRCVLEKATRSNLAAFVPCSTTTVVGNHNLPQMFLADKTDIPLSRKLKPVPGTRGVTLYLFGSLPTIKTVPGTWINIHLMARNHPERYETRGMPNDLHLDPIKGILCGQIKQSGTFSIQVTAQGTEGNGTGILKMIIEANPLTHETAASQNSLKYEP